MSKKKGLFSKIKKKLSRGDSDDLDEVFEESFDQLSPKHSEDDSDEFSEYDGDDDLQAIEDQAFEEVSLENNLHSWPQTSVVASDKSSPDGDTEEDETVLVNDERADTEEEEEEEEDDWEKIDENYEERPGVVARFKSIFQKKSPQEEDFSEVTDQVEIDQNKTLIQKFEPTSSFAEKTNPIFKSKFSFMKKREHPQSEQDERSEAEVENFSTEEIPKRNILASFLEKIKDKKAYISPDKNSLIASSLDLKNLSAEEIFKAFYAPNNRQKIHRVFLYLLATTLFYNSGKLTALYLTDVFTPTNKGLKSIDHRIQIEEIGPGLAHIKNTNLFNVKESLTDNIPSKVKFRETDKICRAAQKNSELPLKLMHTVVLQDSIKSVASVQIRGKIYNIREGDKLENMAEVGRIARLQLVFKNLKSGECEFIKNSEEAPSKLTPLVIHSPEEGERLLPKENNHSGITNNGNSFKIKKKVRDELLGNMGEILTQARAIQITNPDGTLSYKMVEIVPGSIYSKMGIEDGDIVSSINGKKFSNYNELLGLFGRIKDIDRFEITLDRDGNVENKTYEFE